MAGSLFVFLGLVRRTSYDILRIILRTQAGPGTFSLHPDSGYSWPA